MAEWSAKVGAVISRMLRGRVCVTQVTMTELGIPSRAIRSRTASELVWIDARRLRRHMRKYNSYEQRQKRAAFWSNKLPAGSCAVGTAPGFSSVSWEWTHPERYRK